jgi:hypothetical protein
MTSPRLMKREKTDIITLLKNEIFYITAVRFNHSKPSRMIWGEMILGWGGLQVHNSRIETLVRRIVFIICNI